MTRFNSRPRAAEQRQGNGARRRSVPCDRRHRGTDNSGAVRVARALYEAVVRDLLEPLVERLPYVQIVAWIYQDHPGEVQTELQRQVTGTPP